MGQCRFLMIAVAVLVGAVAGSVGPAPVAGALTFTVDTVAADWPTNSDSDTTDGICDDGTGFCSLRAAIEQANASPGTDTIEFSIDSGVQTIAPNTGLPAIEQPVSIDGTTQPGFAGSPIIEIDGSSVATALYISAGNSTVQGLVINRAGTGILLLTNGGNTLQGNYIGTDVSGTLALGNTAAGIHIKNSPGNTIGGTAAGEGNLISGNYKGIRVQGLDAVGNVALGNLIGTDVNGTADLGNTQEGIWVEGAPDTTIGGTAAGAGNVISGNDLDGIHLLSSNASGTVIQGNYIGTDVNGTSALGNGGQGVYSNGAADNIIGGLAAGAGNLISDNAGYGVYLHLGSATGNVVRGNLIGTDVNGTADLGNALAGVRVNQGTGNTIGGTEAGEGNLISGNDGDGVEITAGGNLVQGNLIGTDINGTADLGNAQSGVFSQAGAPVGNVIGGTEPGARNIISGNDSHGVETSANVGDLLQGNYIGTDISGTVALGNAGHGVHASANHTIGGTAPGAGNVIAFNGGDGVFSVDLTTNLIRGNSIHSNAGLGIDLQLDGVRENVVGDFIYANNFPVIDSVSGGAGVTTIAASLHSRLNTTFDIDFYSNSECDPSGNGEGAAYLGSTTETTDGSGDVDFTVDLPTDVPWGYFVTATATDVGGSTSEFSDCAPSCPDGDGDGFDDCAENFQTTDPAVACAQTTASHDENPDPWPPDADDDRDVDIGDVLALFFGKVGAPAAYTPRSDFDADGDIDVGDLIGAFLGRIGTSCA